ncbi:MAG: hypothetical protein JJE25_06535 [Bacteroidia bacterium]|nr:hypothetical protein [Bacteroidia bacterium]
MQKNRVMKKAGKRKMKGAKPVKRIKKQEELTEEERNLENQISRVSVNARRRAYSNNASVTVIRNGKIIRISAGKKERVIGKVHKTRITVDVTKPIRIK